MFPRSELSTKDAPGAQCVGMLVILLLAAAPWAPAQQAVVIANADFETIDDAGGPQGWVYIEPKDGQGGLTAGEGRDGGHAALVSCTRLAAGWGPGAGQTGIVTVQGGRWYQISFWARAQGLYSGAFAALRDTTNWQQNRLWQQFFPGAAWRQYSFKFYCGAPLPAETSRLQFSFDSVGRLWIDDVSIAEAEPDKPANVLDVEGRRNLIPNSSFELGSCGWATQGHDELFGVVDDTTHAHGERSFRIHLTGADLPVHYNDFTYKLRSSASHTTLRSLPLCPIGYCPVTRGKAVTLSFHAKASPEGLPVVASLIDGAGRLQTRRFSVGAQWQRLSYTAICAGNIVFPTIAVDASDDTTLPVTLWIDAVQLEQADAQTDYAPAFPVEASLQTGREANTFTVGQRVTAALRIANYKADATATAHVRVEDFFGATRTVYREDIPVSGGARLEKAIDSGIDDPGFYRFHLEFAGDGWSTSSDMRAAVIFPFEERYGGSDGFLGINHAFVSDRLMRRCRAMGVTWVRSWFCKWQDVQPEADRFDFTEADLQYRKLKNMGMNVLLCLSDPSTPWASTAPETLPGTTGGEAQSRRVWWLPRSFDEYQRYVQTVAEHFGDGVRHYEVFNEPSNRKGGEGSNLDLMRTYPSFLERARRAVQAVSPHNRVLGAGLGYFSELDDLSPIISKVDIVSEHRYPRLSPTQNMLRSLALVHEQAVKAGSDRPMWITEYGVYADDDPDPTTVNSRFLEHHGKSSEMLAATSVAKHHIIALASGVKKVFFHIGNWPFVINREHGCSFHPCFEYGGVPRKTYSTLNTLAWMLPPGTRHVRTWAGEEGFFAFEFAHGKKTIVALWVEGAAELPSGPAQKVADTHPELRTVCGGRAEALPQKITESPLYVVATTQPQQRALDELLRAMCQ